MNHQTYQQVIATLEKFYSTQGMQLFKRHNALYPFIALPSKGEELHEVLGLPPPRFRLYNTELPIYNPQIVEQIRAQGARLYNGITFAFDSLELNPLRIYAKIGNYYDHLATCVSLEHELLQRKDHPTRTHLHTLVEPAQMLTSGAGRSAALGVSTLIVFKQEAGYRGLFTRRSMQTAHKPGTFHVMPAFMLQPSGYTYPPQEWNLATQIMREYLEELFNVPENLLTHEKEAQPPLQHLKTMLSTGDAQLSFSGVVLNLMSTHLSLTTLLLIHDETWYPRLTEQNALSWETLETYLLPIDTDETLLAALPPDAYREMSCEGAAALWMGVDMARKRIAARG